MGAFLSWLLLWLCRSGLLRASPVQTARVPFARERAVQRTQVFLDVRRTEVAGTSTVTHDALWKTHKA